jgi:signal transduction histidine kinase
MTQPRQPSPVETRPWRIVTASVGALIVAIVVVGVIAIALNERVKAVTERALLYEVEVEDEGDDVRIAVLDLRHLHRDIVFNGPSATGFAEFDRAYAALTEEIEELEQVGLPADVIPSPGSIHETAERYYAAFRPAILLYDDDEEAFSRASTLGLRQIESMDRAAQQIDLLGEELVDTALVRVEEVTTAERMVLIALVVGVALVGVALAVSVSRVLAGLRGSYAREQEAARHLARALRTKTDFIADASHELRTPLTVIRGNAEIGLTTADEAVRGAALVDIEQEAKRMGGLVDDLLFLARSDAGLPPLEREFLPARWLLGQVGRRAESLARQRGARLTTEITGEGYLEADPDRVQQAVLVLVDNALKHASDGDSVALRANIRAGALRIDVVDGGPGIPPEELPLIFDRFYQVGDRRARKKGGSGLGLSIARTIVQAHGGSLVVDSTPGKGTTMTIVLPLCPQPEPSPIEAPAIDAEATGAGAPAARQTETDSRPRLRPGGVTPAGASRQ